jgi:hypothetical protein
MALRQSSQRQVMSKFICSISAFLYLLFWWTKIFPFLFLKSLRLKE